VPRLEIAQKSASVGISANRAAKER
jgi:hypothetical protein